MADYHATEEYLKAVSAEAGIIIRNDEIDIASFSDEPDYSHLLKDAPYYRDKVLALFSGMMETNVFGIPPWGESKILYREGETTAYTGINNSGKSLLIGQLMLWLARGGETAVIASMEMRPERTIWRMVRQLCGGENPSLRLINRAIDWLSGKIAIYEHLGTVKSQQMLAVTRYCASKGYRHILIDSLLKCGIREDDLDGQKNFVDSLCAIGKAYPMHVHLVVHPRKPPEGMQHRPVSRFDMRGAGAISDQMDNTMAVHRCTSKERELESPDLTDSYREELLAKPDTLLICDKQRNGEWTGTIPLWFDRPSMQFLPRRGRGLLEIMPI